MSVAEYLRDTKSELRTGTGFHKGSCWRLFLGWLCGLSLCCFQTVTLAADRLSEQDESMYSWVDESGTVHLTNRPDGDEHYQLFGRFLKRGMGMFDTQQLRRQIGSENVTRLAEQYARAQGVETRLILAIIETESGFEPKAVSRAGARGLMQLMPGTERDLGVRDVFDPDENIEGGVRYFRAMLDRYGGKVEMALAAYNAGPAAVDKYGGIPPFPETQRYVRKVLEFWK